MTLKLLFTFLVLTSYFLNPYGEGLFASMSVRSVGRCPTLNILKPYGQTEAHVFPRRGVRKIAANPTLKLRIKN